MHSEECNRIDIVYSIAQIKGSGISALKAIAQKYKVDIKNCLERQEIIDKLVESGKVKISEDGREDAIPLGGSGSSPSTYRTFTSSFLETLSSAELKRLMQSLSISVDNCWDKHDLMSRFREARHVQITS